MIKAATKAEVVQVAKDLLDPLLENIHRDVENLRADHVILEKRIRAVELQNAGFNQRLAAEHRQVKSLLEKVLAKVVAAENAR